MASADDEIPLVRRTAEGLLEAGVERIVVVVGREADAVRDRLEGLGLRFVVNAAYASGMSSSLRAGVEEAIRVWPDASWFLIALGDQPLAGTGVVETLVRACREEAGRPGAPRIVAPRFRGEPGNPVLFAAALAPELLATSGDRGARPVVERDPARVRFLDFDFPAPLDVDTPGDLAALRARQRGS